MREFFDALVDRIGRTYTKNKNGRYERPEKPFLPVTERVLAGGRSLVKPQTQQKKDLVCGIGNRVERLSHHAGGTRNQGSPQLQDCDQSVGKERANYGQHTTNPSICESYNSAGLSRKKEAVDNPSADYTDSFTYLCNLRIDLAGISGAFFPFEFAGL